MYYSIISLFIIIVFLIVVVRLRRKNKRLREKLEMEKNLIELEQKALRLQMNPHFIFNVLTSIHNLIILNDSDKARYALAKFSKLMRRVLENSREKTISIESEIETLENYVQLERLTSGVDVDLEFEIDPDLVSSEEILPPLLIQPFVENAIWHGLMHKDGQRMLTITFTEEPNYLTCVIEDNGVGREAARLANSHSGRDRKHSSKGILVSEERLKSTKNANGKPGSIELIDLYDDLNRPSGTRVVIKFSILN